MLEQKLMEILIGAGAVAGATAFGFYRAHRTAREEGERSRAQIAPIAMEVSGPEGEPGLREILNSIAEDAREAKESAANTAKHSAAFHTDIKEMEERLSERIEASDANQAREIGLLTGRVDALDSRVTALEGIGQAVTDLRARIETTKSLRRTDLELSDAATGVGATTTEGGPASARADRPENPPPPPQHGTLSESTDGEQ
jgi:polyhydroxyalkanoate synthesis regulator phasin